MRRRNKWLRLGFPAGATILLLAVAALFSGVSPAFAVDNVVRVEPAGVEVAPGGSFHVKVIDDPTPASTAIWALDLVYDPAVVTTDNQDCVSINTPPGAIGAFDCQVIDANNDGAKETVKVLGVVLFTGSQTGLVDESTLADITFHAVGAAGTCTGLHLRIRSHADKNGEETGALVQDGQACIQAAAPPSGTASAVPFTPRTSEPTDPPTPGGATSAATPSGGQQSNTPGQPGPTGGQSPGSGSTAPTDAAGGIVSTPPVGGGNSAVEDDGGTSALVWVLGGGIVLVLAAAGAWMLVRVRGGKPPAEPPAADSPPS